MRQEKYTAFITSVIIHILLLFLLTYSASKSTITPHKILAKAPAQTTAIKSFLYVKPKKTTQRRDNSTTQNTPVENKQSHAAKASKAKPIPVKSEINEKDTTLPQRNKAVQTASKEGTRKPTVSKYSSLKSLSHLKAKLDKQNRELAFKEATQYRSASIMHASQIPVPATKVALTIEQERRLNTSSSHFSSITKNGDGTCTIHREQMLGSPVAASTSVFSCGENDFDRSFRLHMEKVQSKLPTYK